MTVLQINLCQAVGDRPVEAMLMRAIACPCGGQQLLYRSVIMHVAKQPWLCLMMQQDVASSTLTIRDLQEVLLGLLPGRMDAFGKTLLKQKQHLVNYMIFLRVTPFLPSWFINTASPVVDFPFKEYITGTAVGLQPLNFILVQAGQTLGQLNSYQDLYSLWNVSKLGVCAVLAVSPVLYQRFCGSVSKRRPSFKAPRRTSGL